MPEKLPLGEQKNAVDAWDALSCEDRLLTLHVLFVLRYHLFSTTPDGGLEKVKVALAPYAKCLFTELPPLFQEALRKREKGHIYEAPFRQVELEPQKAPEKHHRFWHKPA